jgi:hypothetical protein
VNQRLQNERRNKASQQFEELETEDYEEVHRVLAALTTTPWSGPWLLLEGTDGGTGFLADTPTLPKTGEEWGIRKR